MGDNNKAFGWADTNGPLVAPHFEYHRKNRWVMEFLLPAPIQAAVSADSLRLNLYSAARPSKNYDETTVHRMNGEVFLPGKPHFEPLTVSFYDNVVIDVAVEGFGGVASTSGIMEAWNEMIYQPKRGDAFGAVPNLKGKARLHMLRPTLDMESGVTDSGIEPGGEFDWSQNIAQSWDYVGIFPQNTNYGDLSYDNSEAQMVEVTFRYDRSFLVEPAPLGA